MHRRRLLAGFSGAALAAACGCRRSPEPNTTIRVAASPYLASSPFYLADEQGYFVHEGLRVEAHSITTSNETIPLLADGAMEVGLYSISPAMVNAVARGARIRIIAAREIASPDCGTFTLCARRGLLPNGMAGVRELRGRRVAIYSRANTAEYILDLVVASSGLRSTDIQIVPLRTAEAVAALSAGKIDAMLTDFIAAARLTKAADVVTVAHLGALIPRLQFSYILFGRGLLEADPRVGGRFLRAYLRGSREFMSGKTPRFLDRFVREGGVDPALATGACRSAFSTDGAVNLPDLQRFIDWAVDRGYCSQRLEAARMVDGRFIALAGHS